MNNRQGFDVESIKAANPLPEFLRARGVELRGSGAGILQGKCPFHNEQNGAALTVWPEENRWHCFGKCAAGGDVITALMQLDGVDFKPACERLGGRAESCEMRAKPVPAQPTKTPLPEPPSLEQVQMQAEYSRRLAISKEFAVKQAARRGWQPKTVRELAQDGHLGLTAKSRLAFIYERGIKLRWQLAGERRIIWEFGGNSELWRTDRLRSKEVHRVYIAEGETDAICLLDTGLESGESVVVAIPCAPIWHTEWNPMLTGRDVVVVTDADEAGEKAAALILSDLAGVAARVVRVNPLDLLPADGRDGAKDIGDVHNRRGRDELRAALLAATDAALKSAGESAAKSAKSAKLPEPEPKPVNFDDFEEFVSEDSEENENPFPLDTLPGVAGAMAREAAAAALVPDTLTAMNVLGILSAAIGAGLEVASGGDRRTRGNLFLMPVAASGTGKGQSFGLIVEPFLAREAARLDEWRRVDRPQAAAKFGITEARLEQLKKDAKKELSGDDKAMLLTNWQAAEAERDAAERALHDPVWSTEQATLEAIQSLFAISTQEQLASLSSEARGAVDTLMGRYRDATDESIFLAGYSGDSVKIHRKGSKPIVLARPCLTLLWLLQPDKMREMIESTAMSESGLLPRFLLADTKAEPQPEPDERHSVPDETKTRWTALIQTLLDEYHEPQIRPRVIEPERAAAALLRDYANEIVQRRRSGGDLADVAIYAARWAENAWRLAVVLHAAEHGADAWQETLSAGTAAAAVRLMRWFSSQQLRALETGRQERLAKRLDRLCGILMQKSDRQCNLSDLTRRHGFDVAEVKKLALAFPGAVNIEKLPSTSAGRPPQIVKLVS